MVLTTFSSTSPTGNLPLFQEIIKGTFTKQS